MPKLKMTTLLINIFLLLTTCSWAQSDLGIGVISINFKDKDILSFYLNTQDSQPLRKIEFFNDPTINSLNILNLKKNKLWLKPEVLEIDNSSLILRCVETNDQWLKVIVNNQSNSTLWIKRSKLTKFMNWESYLKKMFGVARLPELRQKIRTLPNDNSKEILYTGQDCYQVKSMKGDWIEIFTSDYCDESYTESKTKIKSGWIRWKNGSKLLIEYFITS